MKAKLHVSKESAVRGRFWRVGFSLAIVALVFFTVQTVQPVLNSHPTGASHTNDGWIGAKPAFAAQADGEKIYMTRCMSCHQSNGQGVTGVFPPLAESEYVTGDADRLVKIILHGVTGEIEVNGVQYSGAMPPWGTFLKDDEIAALSTYIRSSWGNEASAVSAEQVAGVREATMDRKQPWTAADLNASASE